MYIYVSMLQLHGSWQSKVISKLQGRVAITLDSEQWVSEMKGSVKFLINSSRPSAQFDMEAKYEQHVVEGIIIDRLFIRQKEFTTDTYHTVQLTSYNGGPWNGIYTSVYPCDYGEITGAVVASKSDTVSTAQTSVPTSVPTSGSKSSSGRRVGDRDRKRKYIEDTGNDTR